MKAADLKVGDKVKYKCINLYCVGEVYMISPSQYVKRHGKEFILVLWSNGITSLEWIPNMKKVDK